MAEGGKLMVNSLMILTTSYQSLMHVTIYSILTNSYQ